MTQQMTKYLGDLYYLVLLWWITEYIWKWASYKQNLIK